MLLEMFSTYELVFLNFFWEMGDFNKQNTLLCAPTQRAPIKKGRDINQPEIVVLNTFEIMKRRAKSSL